eukprot:1161598-Pelagomonas_calceolata.AAC.2
MNLLKRLSSTTKLQNMSANGDLDCTTSGNKLVGILNRMGMKFANNFNGTLVVKSQLFEVAKGMLRVAA